MRKPWLCRFECHKWKRIGDFLYCTRPGCTEVRWLTGTYYWDLDICDTRLIEDWKLVQE